MSIETSAKAGHNVKTLFKKIAMALPGGSSEPKEATPNQSTYQAHRRLYSPANIAEIDVSASPEQAVPEASGCQC